MREVQRVLVATDLSIAAGHTFGHAAGFARAYDAPVTLLHVDEHTGAGFGSSPEVAGYLKQLATRKRALLEQARETFAPWNVSVQVKTVAGTPSQRILGEAAATPDTLVVLAKSGLRGVDRLLFGSTTKRVIRGADCPVLVIQPPRSNAAPLSDRPASYESILATTDFGHDSERGLVLALLLADRLDARLLLTHVLRTPPILPLAGGGGLAVPQQALAPLRGELERRLQAVVAAHASDRLRGRLLVSDAVAPAIVEEARDESADLIVVPSHGKGAVEAVFVGSTSEAVLRRADVPVLVLPRPYLKRASV